MTTTIRIVQKNQDKTDYLKLIIKLLNGQFTNPKSMKEHWRLNCLKVAQELGGKIIELGSNSLTFDFTGIGQ